MFGLGRCLAILALVMASNAATIENCAHATSQSMYTMAVSNKAMYCLAPNNKAGQGWMMLYKGNMAGNPTGEFSGGGGATCPGTNCRATMTAAELSDMYDNKDQKVEFMVQTDSGHSLIIGPYGKGKVDMSGFGGTCTDCNCGGNQIADSDGGSPNLYWHGGRGGCFGSSHFGMSFTGDVHCNQAELAHFGHFHRAHINSGVYNFGGANGPGMFNEAEWSEVFHYYVRFVSTPEGEGGASTGDGSSGSPQVFTSGTKTCSTDGCSISYTFDFSSVGGTIASAMLAVEQSGDTDGSDEYTELKVGGTKVADCKTSTNSWATATACSSVDVTSRITSSKTLVVLVDATSAVGADDDEQNGPMNTELAVRLTATITSLITTTTADPTTMACTPDPNAPLTGAPEMVELDELEIIWSADDSYERAGWKFCLFDPSAAPPSGANGKLLAGGGAATSTPAPGEPATPAPGEPATPAPGEPVGSTCTADVQCAGKSACKSDNCCGALGNARSCQSCDGSGDCDWCADGYYLDAEIPRSCKKLKTPKASYETFSTLSSTSSDSAACTPPSNSTKPRHMGNSLLTNKAGCKRAAERFDFEFKFHVGADPLNGRCVTANASAVGSGGGGGSGGGIFDTRSNEPSPVVHFVSLTDTTETWYQMCYAYAKCTEEEIKTNAHEGLCQVRNTKGAVTALAIVLGLLAGVFALHFLLTPSEDRNFELYLLVFGGLADAATDAVYIAFEQFYSPALEIAALGVLGMPFAVVTACFWAVMVIDYSHQRWRVLFLPIEGPLWLLAVVVGVGSSAVGGAWKMIVGSEDTEMSASLYGWGSERVGKIWDTVYVKETSVTRKVQDPENPGEMLKIVTSNRFYKRGLPQLLVAAIFAPAVLVVVAAIVGVLCLVIWAAKLAFFVVASSIGMLLAVGAASLIASVFSVMAFLRLFVILPAAWSGLKDLTMWFAEGVHYGCPTDWNVLDEERRDRVARQLFGEDNDAGGSRSSDDLISSAIKYLAVEFILESVPQIIIQSVNNNSRNDWSEVGIASMAVSVFAIVSAFYKYSNIYVCPNNEVVTDAKGKVRDRAAAPAFFRTNPAYDKSLAGRKNVGDYMDVDGV